MRQRIATASENDPPNLQPMMLQGILNPDGTFRVVL
jgi:hypothetical protein